MFVDERDPSYPEIECPDNQAGLYIIAVFINVCFSNF
jgi:hypothetical protein